MAEQAPTPSANPSPRRTPGRRVVLVFLLLLPAIVVPLLLSGRAEERQVCLRTLAQRSGSYFETGSLRWNQPSWTLVDEWPEPSERYEWPDALRGRPDMPPSEWSRLVFDGEPERLWVTIERSLPFAFVIPVRNTRALRPERMDILDVKLLAAAVFDATTEQGAKALRELDRRLSAGFAEAEALRPNQRRRRPPTPGEDEARRLLDESLRAMTGPDPVAAVRAVLSEPREGRTVQPESRRLPWGPALVMLAVVLGALTLFWRRYRDAGPGRNPA